MAGRMNGKVGLVTGGGSGIGRATALTFAREGAKVVVVDVAVDNGSETVRLIKESGGEAIFLDADVSKSADVVAMVDEAIDKYGRLDCAFNNAGVDTDFRGPLHECPDDEWDHIINVNLKGVWFCMKYEIPQMLKQGSGTIVNMSSIMGIVGAPGTSIYTASKHGVSGLTKAAALEYAPEGIRINAVCPSRIRTPLQEHIFESNPGLEGQVVAQQPNGRLGATEEVAEAVVWLSSDAASFVTGHLMAIDGGYLAQ